MTQPQQIQFLPSISYDPKDVSFNSSHELTPFSENLAQFVDSFEALLIAKNKAYGNSALKPINVFSKASSSDVILQQIDHKLSRIKNSDIPSKNDMIDLMGYLTLYCIDQEWTDLSELIN